MENASLFDDSLDTFHAKALGVASPSSPCLDDSLCLDDREEFQTPPAEVEKNVGETDSALSGTHTDPSRAKSITVSVKKVTIPLNHSPPTAGQRVPSVNLGDSMEHKQEPGSVPQASSPALHAAGAQSSPAMDMATYVMEELFPTTIDDDKQSGPHKLGENDQEGSSAETAQPLESDVLARVDSGGVGEEAPRTTSNKKADKPEAKKVVPSFGKKKKNSNWVPPMTKGSPPAKPPTVEVTKGNSDPDHVTVGEGEENGESCRMVPEPLNYLSPSTENNKPNLISEATSKKKKEKSKSKVAASDKPTESKVSKRAAKPLGETKKANQEAKKLAREEKAKERELKRIEKEQRKAERDKEKEMKRLEVERRREEREQKKNEKELKKLKKGRKQAEEKDKPCKVPQVMEAALASSPVTREPDLLQNSAKSEPQEQPTSPHAIAFSPIKLSSIDQSELEVVSECLKIDLASSMEKSVSSQKSQESSDDVSQNKDCDHEAKIAAMITTNVAEDMTSSGMIGSTGEAHSQPVIISGASVSNSKSQAKKSQRGGKKKALLSPPAIVAIMAARKQSQLSSKDGQTSIEAKVKQEATKVTKAPRPPKRARKKSNHRGSLEPRRKRSRLANYSGPVWVQCIACGKWRQLSDCQDPCSLPEMWDCSMNTGISTDL